MAKTIVFEKPTDIVITDPSYIVKPEDWKDSTYSETGDYGVFLEKLGLHCITSKTLGEYWRCVIVKMYQEGDTLKTEEIGKFSTDVGLVGVFDLGEVVKYNPKFEDNIKTHTPIVIRDFEGEVNICKLEKKGKPYISLNGVCKVNGKLLYTFIAKQV